MSVTFRGRGLFWGVEIVANRALKRPFDPAYRVNARIKAAAMEAGMNPATLAAERSMACAATMS